MQIRVVIVDILANISKCEFSAPLRIMQCEVGSNPILIHFKKV